jgi:hypothetical protein
MGTLFFFILSIGLVVAPLTILLRTKKPGRNYRTSVFWSAKFLALISFLVFAFNLAYVLLGSVYPPYADGCSSNVAGPCFVHGIILALVAGPALLALVVSFILISVAEKQPNA